MATRGVSISVPFVVWDTTNNEPMTGDNLNLAIRWIKDGTAAAPTNGTTEIDAVNAPGLYRITLTATETDCNIGVLAGRSATPDVSVIPLLIQFERLPDASPGTDGGLPTVNAGNHVAGVQTLAAQAKTDVRGECDAALVDYGAVVPTDLPANFAALQISVGGHVSRVTLVDTTTANTDMRGTEGAYTGLPPTVTEIREEVDANSTQLAAIATATNTLQADWVDGGRLDVILDAGATSASVTGLRDLLEADRYIDTSVTPWQLVLIRRGSGTLSTGVELLRQDLYDVNGMNISSTDVIVGESVSP